MRAMCLAGLLAAAMAGAAGAQDATCDLPSDQAVERLAAESSRAAPLALVSAIQSGDFVLGAKYYGYLLGRYLQNAAPGSADRACALMLDGVLDQQLREISELHQAVYRLALTGALDSEIDGVYELDLPSWAQTPVAAPKLQHGAEAPWSDWLPVTDIAVEPSEPISVEAASEAVCPAGGDPEYSPAWLRFQRWMEIEYLRGVSRYTFRWDDMRDIWGQAVSRVAAAAEGRPERAAALACIQAQLDAIIEKVGRSEYYDADSERALMRDAMEGKRDDEVRRQSRVSSHEPASDFFDQLGEDVGVDLAADYSEPPAGDAAVAAGDDVAAAAETEDPWEGLCTRDALADAGYHPLFAQLSTVFSNVYVYIDPVSNEYVHLVGCERVPFDMQAFEAEWEELDTVYPDDGSFARIVSYKNRTRNEWTRLGWY